MNNRDRCFTALMAALLCLVGPIAIPAGPIPLSLAGLGIYLAGGVLGVGRAALAALIYIMLGTAGLPVFSGWSGGAAHLIGPAGGFIMGYVPCAAVCGLGKGRSKGVLALWMGLGTLVMYAAGTAWFMFETGSGIAPALAGCVLPFLPGDAVKIAAAAFTSEKVHRRLSVLNGWR